MKHIFLSLLICFLFVPVTVHGQATKSVPLGKNIGIDTHVVRQPNNTQIDRVINQQIAKARQQAEQQKQAQVKAEHARAMKLTQDELDNESEYVSTPQGDIRKGSWQACEYFFNWDKHQQQLRKQNVEVYESQRDMVLLTFGLTEEHCNVLAYRRQKGSQPLQLPESRPYFAQNRLPLDQQIAPIAYQPVGVPEQEVAQAGEPAEQEKASSRKDNDFVYPEYVDREWSPRQIKRALREYTARYCNQIQEALTLKAQKKYLRSRHRIVLTGYTSLCRAYKRTLGEPADVCVQASQCKPQVLKPKEEQAFIDKYNEAAARQQII